MTKHHVVAPGKTILYPKGVERGPGTSLDDCPEEAIRSWVNNEFAVEATAPGTPAPGAVQKKYANAAELEKQGKGPSKPAPTKPSSPGQKQAPPAAKWDLDPETLRGLPLEQLNLMVRERDPNVAPFDNVDEAIAQLSVEFRKPS